MSLPLSAILQILQEAQHGGSGKGISFWTKAAANGRQVRLEQEDRAARAGAPVLDETAEPSDKLNALMIGTAYHLLQEHASGDVSENVWDAREGAFTGEFAEAVRLYRAYQSRYTSVSDRWGFTEYRTEVPLPATPEGAARALELYGEEVTGRLDGVGFISMENLPRVMRETGLALPGPGWYLLDLKTAGRESPNDVWTYEQGLQACNYITLWNLENPDNLCHGMIFDQIIRTKVPKFKAYFAPAFGADPERVRNLVKIGRRNLTEDLCVPTGCQSFFGPCYWRKCGKCPGY